MTDSFKTSCANMSNLFTSHDSNNNSNNNNSLLSSSTVDSSSVDLFQQKGRERRKFSVIDDFASLYSSLGYHGNPPLGYFGHVNEACSLPFSGCNKSFGGLSNSYNNPPNNATNIPLQSFSRSSGDRSSNVGNSSNNSVSGE